METILVIDDCAEVLQAVSMILDDAGYSVISTSEPARAIALCKEVEFDAVLCDLFLQEELLFPNNPSLAAGIHTISELKLQHPALRVIAMSGYVEGKMLERITEMGLVGALRKPFGRDSLLSVVQTCLQQ